MEPTPPPSARPEQDSPEQQGAEPQGTLLPIPDPEESRRLLAGLAAAAGSPAAAARDGAPGVQQAAGAPGAAGGDPAGLQPADPAATPGAPFRSGFVALIGRPNVGKSTLLNQLVGQKVAITSPVAQTTRNRLRAILTTEQAQLVLLDTPGIHKPHHLLGQRLVQSARGAIGEVDVVLLLVDGSQPAGRGDAFIVELLRRSGMPVMVALNKWDQVDPAQAEALMASYRALLADGEAAIIAGSAEPAGSEAAAVVADASAGAADGSGKGPASGATALGALVPRFGAAGDSGENASLEKPVGWSAAGGASTPAQEPGTGPAGAPAAGPGGSGPSAPSDSLADAADQPDSPWQAARPVASSWPLFPVSALNGEGTDVLVEALSAALPQGPHLYPPDAISDQPEQLLLAELIREQVLQHTREEVPHSVAVMIDRIVEDGPRTAVLATVLVERSSQKGILIGKGGSMLRTIGQGARLQMQKLISGPVYLELFVKVVPGWRSHPGRLAELGYRGD